MLHLQTKMPRVHWKTKRLLLSAAIVFILYFTIRIKNYDFKASVELDKVHPIDVWEFVADFSNMKFLNPTITDFNVIAESGNYDHWRYSTEYSEHLSHWPYLYNYAVAHFNVKGNPKKDIYYIDSVHRTCLIMGYFCLDSKSQFRFSNTTKGAVCEENVEYQCPAFLSPFCTREVIYQRNAIMKNLKEHFQHKHAL